MVDEATAVDLSVFDAPPHDALPADLALPDMATRDASLDAQVPPPDVFVPPPPEPDMAPPPPEPDMGPPPPEEPPPLDLGNVRWLHTDVSGWAQTTNLASVTFQGGQICLNHDHADAWPPGDIGGVVVAANPWVFIWHEGRWWGATWEWMRPGQTCKNQSSVAGDHIKRAPFDEASGWRPASGQVLYFMVSGLARDAMRNAEERSNPVRVVWP